MEVHALWKAPSSDAPTPCKHKSGQRGTLPVDDNALQRGHQLRCAYAVRTQVQAKLPPPSMNVSCYTYSPQEDAYFLLSPDFVFCLHFAHCSLESGFARCCFTKDAPMCKVNMATPQSVQLLAPQDLHIVTGLPSALVSKSHDAFETPEQSRGPR